MQPDPVRIEEIFCQVISKPKGDRDEFLIRCCGDDQALRARVEALLRSHDSDDSFLRIPERQMQATAAPISEVAGSIIGRYKLLQQIGEGGFGVVFMAEQQQPVHRTVALKVIKLGMDTRQVIARFEAERQALAMMDHPNIARVLDAGATVTGRPYFVMELVRGTPLTEYCDKHKLSTTQRLELFVQVCQAVQHAHQKGIIHRDLKPSNVLVTIVDGQPVPKVIDFGVAKATHGRLTDLTLFTEFRQLIGTPQYMSPEQAESDAAVDVDTRSDIYSLGVLLYELLTGKPPFETKELLAKGIDAMRRAIMENDPDTPSTRLSQMLKPELTTVAERRQCDAPKLLHNVRGDLDCIVMKCLEKDRARRYETANGLAMDIERHLKNEPVIARPASSYYRFRKMVRRNKVAFVAGSAVVCALVLGITVSSLQAIRATRAEHTTDTAREKEKAARIEAVAAEQIALAERATADNGKAEMRELLYSTQMRFAGQKAETPDGISLVRAMLEPWREGEPDLRGWEWYYLNALSHPEQMTLSEDQVRVHTVEWSPDGTRLASGDAAGIVRIWDTATGNVLFTFAGHAGSIVSDVRWCPGDGNRVATSSEDGVVKVWNSTNGIEFFTIRQNTKDGGVPLAWSPDGGILAVGRSSEIVLRSSTDGAEIRTLRGHRGWVTLLAWSEDSKRLASGGRDTSIRVWDPNTGVAVHTIPGIADVRSGPVNALAWTPDSKRLAAAGGGNTVHIWDIDVSLSQPTEFIPHRGGPVLALAWDRSGKRLVTAGGGDRSLKVWDAATLTEQLSLSGHTAPITRVSWNPDGTRIASASWDGTIKVWDAGNAPRNLRVVGKHTGTGDSRVQAMTWSADSRHLISGGDDSMVRVWDVTTNHQDIAFPGSTASIRSIALHPDGRRLAVGDYSGRIKIMDVITGQSQEELPRLTAWIVGLAWSPDGKWFASGDASSKQSARIWDVGSWQTVFTSTTEDGQLGPPIWSPDGTRFAVRSGSGIKIRKFAAGEEFLTTGQHSEPVSGLAWSPDGTQLASASNDGTVKIWNSAGGQEIRTLRGHTGWVIGVRWSPDGTRLATSSKDQTIKIWNPANGQEVFSCSTASASPFSPTGVLWSGSGMMLAFNLGNDVCVLDATTGYALARLGPVPTIRHSGELVQQRLREYLEFQLKYRDEAHPDVLATVAKLAGSLQQSGNLSQAEPLFRRVIALRRKSSGDEDPETHRAVRDIAGLVIAHLKKADDGQTAGLSETAGQSLMRRLESEYVDSPELLSAFYLSLIEPLMDLGWIDEAKVLSRKLPALNPKDVSVITESVHPGNFPPDRVIASDALTLSQIARRFASSVKPAERDPSLASVLAGRLVQFYEAKGDRVEAAAWAEMRAGHIPPPAAIQSNN